MDINLAYRPKGATHAGKDEDGGSWYKKTDAGEWMFIDMGEDGLDDRSWDLIPDGGPAYEYIELPADTASPVPPPKPKDSGGSAFPLAVDWIETDMNSGNQKCTDVRDLSHGMSLRDYFAAKAMQGQMQREKDFGKTVREQGFAKYAAHIAQTSYQLADAMIAARGES